MPPCHQYQLLTVIVLYCKCQATVRLIGERGWFVVPRNFKRLILVRPFC